MGVLRPKAGGHIELVHGGHRVWSSDGAPVNLMPPTTWLTKSVTIQYPSFEKRNAYAFDIYTIPVVNIVQTACVSYSTILPGEWGHDKASPYTLADATLGTVPAGCNYLDVTVKLSRTKAPPTFIAFDAPVMISSEETPGAGNSFKCEFIPGLYVRGFDVRLVGQNVVLRRYQSVTANDNGIEWTPGNAVYYPSGGKREGWTYGGGAGAQNAHLAAIIQSKQGGNVNKERGGSNQCSLTDTKDYSATYAGTITVRPGYIQH